MKILNRTAHFKYKITDTLEAGIVLQGAEVKAIRENRVDLSESFAKVQNGQVYLKNVQIYPPTGGFPQDLNPRQDRKLLLHKNQINNLIGRTSRPGITLVPLSLYSTRNLIKVELGIGEAKTKSDKRKSIKAKDEQRRIDQDLKAIK